jgi:hypothetical protein
MLSLQQENARLARQDKHAATRALVVTGDDKQAAFWRRRFRTSSANDNPTIVLSERGAKGNFLGTLQAYDQVFTQRQIAESGLGRLEQIVMLVGAGTRLSPFTQALGNMKSAFPLPDADASPAGLSIGEAAIRSTSPWIQCLRHGGFDGLVVRWGDEVLIPSSKLAASAGQYSEVDAVRFGWRTDPTSLLASQKEWLLVDRHTGLVLRDIPRQPIDSLMRELSADSHGATVTFVNLGSLAASHQLLRAACDVFQSELNDNASAANWDPYFWIALQCPELDAWEAVGEAEARVGARGFANLTTSVPTFFSSVQRVKDRLQQELGRKLRVGVLDFGEPYWLDAGSHLALRTAFADIFACSERGRTMRAFLGLPDSLANGDSFIKDSRIAAGARVQGSVVIGSEIRDPASCLEGAVVLDSRLGFLQVSPGGAALCSVSDDLRVDGPHGVAFRIRGKNEVAGHESATTLQIGSQSIVMRYDDKLGMIDGKTYSEPVLENPISYRDASRAMNEIDPLPSDGD